MAGTRATASGSSLTQRGPRSTPKNRPEPPNRRSSTAPPAKRQKTGIDLPSPGHSHARTTPSPPATIAADTPVRQSSASRPHARPTQLQHSSSGQTTARTLPSSIANEALQRTTSETPRNRANMEAILRREINSSVYEYPEFVNEFLSIADEPRREAIFRKLAEEPLFQHRQPWSVDCDKLEGIEDPAMYEVIARALDIISQAAFAPDDFRPVRREISPTQRPVDADDANDTCTTPDIIQASLGQKGTPHWARVEFFAECKGWSTRTKEEDQLSAALLQLARYARATLIHQIHRHHVFSIATCGTRAVFVRLGRTGIIHSPPIDLRTNFREFATAAAGLFALSPGAFGYDTRFYFSPPLTAEDNRPEIRRELRVKADDKLWIVLEIICQRKCLVGRATLVLLLARVRSPKERAVLKCIWRNESRPDEGESLKTFQGYNGICQYRWSQTSMSTAVCDRAALRTSAYLKMFRLPLLQAQISELRSRTSSASSTSSRSVSTKVGIQRANVPPSIPPEDRVQSVILMDEGVALWRVGRLPHLLRVLRDGLVGLAGIVNTGQIHRDISEGNILCSPLRSQGETTDLPSMESDDNDNDMDKHYFYSRTNGNGTSTIPHPDDASDSSESDGTVSTQYFEHNSDQDSDTSLDTRVNGLPLDEELGPIPAATYEEYIEKRYRKSRCIGRLYDLEFMVKQDRLNDETRSMERTGTQAFISAQLLSASIKRPVQHTFLHDLESFFWVLFWVVVNHVEPGKVLNETAQDLVNRMSTSDDATLGYFKKTIMHLPSETTQNIKDLENGWNEAYRVVKEFAKFLSDHIYKKDEQASDSDKEDLDEENLDDKTVCGGEKPWYFVKLVIDIFDKHISKMT